MRSGRSKRRERGVRLFKIDRTLQSNPIQKSIFLIPHIPKNILFSEISLNTQNPKIDRCGTDLHLPFNSSHCQRR